MPVGVVQKAFVIPPRFRTFRNPGQVPSRENIELMRLAKKAPEAFTIARLLAHDQPMLSVGSIVKGLGFSMTQANGLERFLGKAMQSTNEVVLRKTIFEKCQQEQFDGAVRSAILQRSLTYWRETKKSLVQVVSPDDLLKALYIGPRGGRWADQAFKIPWKGDKKKPELVRVTEQYVRESARRSDIGGKHGEKQNEVVYENIKGDHYLVSIPIKDLDIEVPENKDRILGYATRRTKAPPIRVLFNKRRSKKGIDTLFVANGNHRAAAAKLNGATHIDVFIPVDHYKYWVGKRGLEKAWGHKYISKKPDGKGGWVYVYPEDKPHPKGQKVFIIDMTKPKPHVLGEEKPSGGTKDPKQLGLFMTKETSKQLGLFTAKVKSKPKVEDKPVAKPVEKLIIREPVKELDVKAEAPEPASVPKDEKEIKKIKAKTKITPTKEEAEKIAREIGEHVWGSRKDLAVIRSSEDLVSMSPGNQAKVATKQYLMPKWDYADLVDSGVDPEAVLVRKAFESCIMAKAPDNLEGRKAYVDGIDFVTRSLDKCKTVKDIHDFVYDWKQLSRSKKLLKSLTVDEVQKIYDEYRESVGSPVKMGWLARKEWRQELKDANSRYYKNEIAASDYIDLKNTAKEAGYKDYSFSHITEAVSWKVGVDDIALEFSGSKYSIYHHDPELKGTSVVIAGRTRNVNKYGFMAAAMGTRIVKALSNSYSTGFYREAPKTLRTAEKIGDSWETQKLSEDEKYDALVDVMEPKKREGKEKRPRFKWERNVPGEINRVGGKPVLTADTQALADIFKFKDIQFGEWVSEEDAESHVKGVHGAFLDLADVLGIDPQTVSMNGRLSISVGARGRGAAKAHYEPGGKIINITKRAGGGSVAHEWAHAMDHLVSIAYHPSSKEMPMLSAKDTIGVAPSVVEAMNEVMQNINYEAPSEAYKAVATEGQVLEKRYRAGERLNYEEQVTLRTYYRERSKVTKSDYLKDASSFSQSADSYWTRPHELFARAFEAAIEDILTDQNRVSSYLVSSTKEIYRTGRYQSDADYKDDKHAQIYPQGETRKRITESVKKLVEALRKDKSLEKAMHYLLDLEKAEVRGGKYHKRIPKKSGKGYHYIYEPESYDSREDAHVDGKQASKAYLNNQVSKCVLKAGEKGCDVAAFKPLVKKFGSKSVASILQEQQTGGKFVFKKGRFYAPKPEKEKL